MVRNWLQEQMRNIQITVKRTTRTAARVATVATRPVADAVQPVARTMAAVARVATHAGAERVQSVTRPAATVVNTSARVATVVARPVLDPIQSAASTVAAAGQAHAAKTEAAEVQRAEQRRLVQEQIALTAMQGAGAVVQKGKDFLASPPARIGSMFAGQQVGRKIDVLAAPARAVNPAVPSYEEHFARHPEDVVKGLAIGASIVVPAGAAARGGALIAGGLASREAARHTATHVIRTGGGGAGYVTPAKTTIENVIKLAGPGATLIGATQWGRPETRTAGGMPTGMPDWMNEWSDPHGGAGYGPAPEIEMPDPADRGERYPGEDFGDYLRYRDELARREGPVRREGPTPYYRGPEIIGGGRTVRSPEMQPGEGILRGPEIIGGGRTVHSPEIDGILEPWQSRPERLQPRDGPTLPTDITAGSAITRTPPRTHRAPSREIVDDSGPRYIFGHDRPTLAPAREMPDLDTWATTLSKDAARDLEIQFGSALSPPGPAAVPRYTLEARLRSRDRSDSLPEWDASPLSLPGTRTEAGARTRTGTGARSGTATGTRTGTRTGVRSGIGTGTIPDIANRLEFPPEYPDRTVEMPPGFETVLRPPRTGDRRRRDRRRDEDEKRKKKSRRRSNASYDWIVENPAQDIESMFGVGSAAAPPDIFGGIAKTPRKRRTRR